MIDPARAASGVVTEAVPWAEHDSRFTRDFENPVAWVAREMNKTAVADLLHIALPGRRSATSSSGW